MSSRRVMKKVHMSVRTVRSAVFFTFIMKMTPHGPTIQSMKAGGAMIHSRSSTMKILKCL